MPGTITPLPIMLEEKDRKIYDQLEPPESMVVCYAYQKLVGEFVYNGDAKPGCGSKLVLRTHRGIELGEMLTTTCANTGCSKSVSRKEMLQYIENSGGKDYPFATQGKVLRVANVEDVNDQLQLDSQKPQMIGLTKRLIAEMELPMALVDIELLLGGERIIFFYTSEQWVDFRELVRRLAAEYQTRIEMHQVNAREEARLVADFERCGQHCCCKQFLKVLKPVSMRSAKVQKATLDPAKISGRCGRLMCCLRYEDQTYESLRKRLPHRQSKVMTDDGPGTVVDSQILTQLVLVRIDESMKTAAYPVENIRVLSKEELQEAQAKAQSKSVEPVERPNDTQPKAAAQPHASPESDDQGVSTSQDAPAAADGVEPASQSETDEDRPRRRRRRRRRRRGGKGRQGQDKSGDSGQSGDGAGKESSG